MALSGSTTFWLRALLHLWQDAQKEAVLLSGVAWCCAAWRALTQLGSPAPALGHLGRRCRAMCRGLQGLQQ